MAARTRRVTGELYGDVGARDGTGRVSPTAHAPGNIAAREALYVAAARGLGCSLLTTDDGPARAVPDLVVGLA